MKMEEYVQIFGLGAARGGAVCQGRGELLRALLRSLKSKFRALPRLKVTLLHNWAGGEVRRRVIWSWVWS